MAERSKPKLTLSEPKVGHLTWVTMLTTATWLGRVSLHSRWTAVVMAICLVPVWAYLAVNQLLCKRKISFQTAAGVIESTTTDWRFRSKTHRYRFEEFHCVRTNLCYVGSKPRCRVELVRKLDGKVLVIAHFPPTTTRSGLFSRWLTKTEPPNAAALRKKLHALMGILDWGYRDGWTGEEITGD